MRGGGPPLEEMKRTEAQTGQLLRGADALLRFPINLATLI